MTSSLPQPFLLERYMARYEFHAAHPLCLSDCEPLSMGEVLEMADSECKQWWTELSLGYTESDGHPALRKEIAGLYSTVQPEEVLVLVPQEAIQIAARYEFKHVASCRAMLKAGDHVVCVAPAYQSLHENARTLGCKVDHWDISYDQSGRPYFSVESLRQLVKPNTKAVFVNFPHNPSGVVPTPEDWESIVSICRQSGAFLFSDEMYRGLEIPPTPTLPSAVDCYPRGVALCGMSKSLGMPGIRLGWLATKDKELFSHLQQLHDYFSICHAAPSEILAIIGLRARKRIVSKNIRLIQQNIRLAEDFFSRHKEAFEFCAPSGSSIAFPRLTTGEEVEAFCDQAVKECGVFLLPAQVYAHDQSIQEGRFRIGLGRSNLDAGLQVLQKWLESR